MFSELVSRYPSDFQIKRLLKYIKKSQIILRDYEDIKTGDWIWTKPEKTEYIESIPFLGFGAISLCKLNANTIIVIDGIQRIRALSELKAGELSCSDLTYGDGITSLPYDKLKNDSIRCNIYDLSYIESSAEEFINSARKQLNFWKYTDSRG